MQCACGPLQDACNLLLLLDRLLNTPGNPSLPTTRRCLSGCECEAIPKLDAHHEMPTSTIYLARLLVTESKECVVGVTVLEGTSSGEFKFKISGVMMNEYLGKDVTTQLNEEQWMTTLQASAGRR